MWVAIQGERSRMPAGMCSRQNDIVRPKMRAPTPADLRCAAAARP